MTPNVRRFIEVVTKNITLEEPIVEIGSYIVRGHEKLANLRELFPGTKFIGCDIRKGPGVDRIENVEKLTFKNESIGAVLMLETIEHVQNCIQAVDEIYRVLKKNGVLVLSSLMNFQIHDFPEDYWRFTPKGFEYLLRKFPIKIIGFQGEQEKWEKHPTNIFGIGFKNKNDRKIAKLLLAVLKTNAAMIKGRKPWRHRLSTAINYAKEAVCESTHKYYLKYYIVEKK
jgi:SAM-dependent methyltransferase